MTIVTKTDLRSHSQVRRIDAQLDRLQLQLQHASDSEISSATTTHHNLALGHQEGLARVTHLQTAIKSLVAASSSQPLLPKYKLRLVLEQALDVDEIGTAEINDEHRAFQNELEWLFIGKATTQIYGIVLNAFLDQILPLGNDIWYWDDVLGSYAYSGYYTLQTSPSRFWAWSKDIYGDALGRFQSIKATGENESLGKPSMSAGWTKFYELVKDSIRDRSMADMQNKFMTPLTQCRIEARRKQKQLKRLREMSASGLGVLMYEGMSFDTDEVGSVSSKSADDASSEEWKSIVSKSVALMATVLDNVTGLETRVTDFEDAVFGSVEQVEPIGPAALAKCLLHILDEHVPEYTAASKALVKENGRPPRIVRYWIPATVLVLSSSTILRILFNHKAEVLHWIRDLGSTTQDFWYNWVVEPIKKVIGTIRHDKDSEIAIMSKESLEGDRSSLERMVVDFAIDNPSNSSSSPLNEVEIASVRAKVREGDLTPVLRAYERDLRKPFMGTVRGDLIRALLIQIQKTKVDVEVALGGIDALLKSQELVFA